jgi:hypothetical protein
MSLFGTLMSVILGTVNDIFQLNDNPLEFLRTNIEANNTAASIAVKFGNL